MMRHCMVLVMGLALYSSFATGGTGTDRYRMFPEAKEGYTRYIIEVPKTENDNDHKVEMLIGKSLMVDCNHVALSGKLTKNVLRGWGYYYFVLSHIEQGAKTMMACSQPKVEKFITLRPSPETTIPYNSRLGTVIYVPKEVEVRYRIWSAEKNIETASQR